jgi:hypothetical protein
VLAVRREPVTVSRALGEAAVVKAPRSAARHDHNACKKEASIGVGLRGGGSFMIEFVCDTCSAVKEPEEAWIVGLAAEAVGAVSARREEKLLYIC